jgi:hypothetical protein
MDKVSALKFEEIEKQKTELLEERNLELQARLEKLEGAISALLTSSQSKTQLV